MAVDESRALTTGERRLLDGLLAHDFPGVTELRVQALGVRARKGCQCGCGTIDLIVPEPRPPRSEAANPVPVEGVLRDDAGGVLLFVSDGMLASLEVCSFGDPLPLPRLEQVTWEGP